MICYVLIMKLSKMVVEERKIMPFTVRFFSLKRKMIAELSNNLVIIYLFIIEQTL